MSDLSKLKICFVAGTLGQGGAERQLFHLVRSLWESRASVRVLCLDRGAFWEKPIRNLGVPVSWVGQARFPLRRLWRIIRELETDLPEIVQSQHFYTNVYACAAARWLGISGIGALRSNGVFDLLGSGRLGGQLNLRLPRMVAANSQAAINHALRLGVDPGRLFFLPNVVDTDHFTPGPDSERQPLSLLNAGRVTREKRFDRFLRILAELRHTEKLNVRGLIVGPTRTDQKLKPELERLAGRLGLLPDGVQFRPGTAEMRPVYQQSDIYVLTSDFEGTPNVLLEAMASALPIVATSVGGVPAIVRHGQTGFLCAPEDLQEQVRALAKLIRERPLRFEMGRRAREYVEQNHSLHRLPHYLSGLYQLTLAGHRRTATTKLATAEKAL